MDIAAYHLTLTVGAGIVALIIGGTISDRIDRKKVVMTGASLSALFMPMILFVQNQSIWIMAIANGFFLFFSGSVTNAMIADFSKEEVYAKIFALNFSIQAIFGAVITPIAFGWLADSTGLWVIFIATAIFSAAQVPLALMIKSKGHLGIEPVRVKS